MNNNLRCLILSYITNYNSIVKLLSIPSLATLAKNCIVEINNFGRTRKDVKIVIALTNLVYGPGIIPQSILDVIALAKMPKLKQITIELGQTLWSAEPVATIFCEIYLTNGDNRNLRDVNLAFVDYDQQIIVYNGILISHVKSELLLETLIKYKNLFGLQVLPQFYSLDYMLSVDTLDTIDMPNSTEYYTENQVTLAINLINSNKIKLITDNINWLPKIRQNDLILLTASSNTLQIIDIAITIDTIDNVISRYANLKQITIYVNGSYINIINNIVSKYSNLIINIQPDTGFNVSQLRQYYATNNNVKFKLNFDQLDLI